MGYVSLIVTLITGLLSAKALLTFVALAGAMNLCLSTLSILLCVASQRGTEAHVRGLALFEYSNLGDVLVLLFSGVLSSLGYRQYLMGWQLKGLYDFFKGKKGWDKFARKGFAPT